MADLYLSSAPWISLTQALLGGQFRKTWGTERYLFIKSSLEDCHTQAAHTLAVIYVM